MIIIQSINPQTGITTALAEFQLRGDGVHALYHSDRFRSDMERSGIYTAATGKLRPSDGQKFLDALPLYYSNSTCIRVIENNPGGHGRADGSATPPPGMDKSKISYKAPSYADRPGQKGTKGFVAPMETDADVIKRTVGTGKGDEWSDAAREAAAAARAKETAGKEPDEKTPDARHASPAQKKIETKRKQLAQQSKEAHKASETAESPAELQHAHELHAAAEIAQKAHALKLQVEAKNEAISGKKEVAAHTKAEAQVAEKHAASHVKAREHIKAHVEKKAHEHEAKHGKPEGEHEGGEHEPGSNPFRDLLKVIIGTPKR